MAERGYTASKDQLNKRLARIEGQVRGVARMVDDDRYCIDVLTQIAAIQAALDKVALGLLDGHTRHCLIGHGSAEASADELMSAVSRLMRRGQYRGAVAAAPVGAGVGYSASKEDLGTRLDEIEDEVRSVAAMVEADRYCIDVVESISAVQGSLDEVSLGLLDGHTRHCLIGQGSPEASTGELMGAVGRLMRRG
jgi:CsoR family transcriptional regulator, copper-sensing transcriptional repressor